MELDVELDVTELLLDESISVLQLLDIELDFPSSLDVTAEFSTGGGGGGLEQYDSVADFPDAGTTDILYIALDTGKTYYWDADLLDYQPTASGASTKEDITGIKLADSPEFADVKITNLNTGTIPAAQWTWLGATAKSVLSVLTKLIGLLYDLFRVTKEPTGFVDPESVVVTYSTSGRTITLSGTVEAYWQGKVVAALINGWVSDPHPLNPTQNLFLYYNGTSFVWSTEVWLFNYLQIAIVIVSGADAFGQRECHGLMAWQTHLSEHKTIGTYRDGGGTLTALSYALNSTTAADRRPLIDELTLRDEDLKSIITALATESYTQVYLTAAGTVNFTKAAADICRLSGNQPYYNLLTAGVWGQALMTANQYSCIWLVAFPTTNDTESKAYRYQWLQGQSQGTLASQQALFPQNLTLGDYASISPEFVFLAKIIIRYTANNWIIVEVTNLTGTRNSAVGSPAGFYLSGVATDESIDGTGTTTSPLKVTPSHTNTFAAAIDLSCFDRHYSSYTMVGALQLSVASSPVAMIGGCAEGIIVGDGTNTPTLSGITLWSDSWPFDPTAARQNHYTIVKFQDAVYIKWTQLN